VCTAAAEERSQPIDLQVHGEGGNQQGRGANCFCAEKGTRTELGHSADRATREASRSRVPLKDADEGFAKNRVLFSCTKELRGDAGAAMDSTVASPSAGKDPEVPHHLKREKKGEMQGLVTRTQGNEKNVNLSGLKESSRSGGGGSGQREDQVGKAEGTSAPFPVAIEKNKGGGGDGRGALSRTEGTAKPLLSSRLSNNLQQAHHIGTQAKGVRPC